ncbi:alpha/beta hydrolase [Ensifer sp. ENS07]|uniref:alpha/beta fold hydrolase n=1 Tax=Ensifer sp. ENS07 TaxID=2769274 RepID=UPI001783E169|nr:alpha/beta hydrolase [Ensifer sp. ENS07]MBD9639013.1 alpha/beta hydrolase [Ensifer sp. ENS07]
MDTLVRHRRILVADVDTFFREAGKAQAPAVLLPHGYPCSSYEFRNLMPRLADRWRLLAPDFPGAGYSATPEEFDYSFDGYAAWLEAFVDAMAIDRFVLYLHDFGSPIGTRLAMRHPERIVGLIIQNGDIPYEDALGPKYADLEALWTFPTEEMRQSIASAVTEEGFRQEFLNDLPAGLADAIPPDLWRLHSALLTPKRKEAAIDLIAGLESNRRWFPEHRKYLRDHQPPTLIVWGPNDHYMPEASARAYLRDLPDAGLHLLEGGHWLLETHLDQVVELVRDFLTRLNPVADGERR